MIVQRCPYCHSEVGSPAFEFCPHCFRKPGEIWIARGIALLLALGILSWAIHSWSTEPPDTTQFPTYGEP